MIVEMHRVLLFGPKRLLSAVLDEVQRLGVLHVDRIEAEETSFEAMALDEQAAAQQSALERLRIRLDGLLTLLPAQPGERPGASGDFAEAGYEVLEGRVAEVEAEVQALSRRRVEIEEELELIETYHSAVRVLSPLLDALQGSKSLETVGFILRTKDLTVVQALRNQLAEITGGRIELANRVIEEGKVGVVIAFLHRDGEAVHRFLTQAGISELRLPARYAELGPAEAVRVMERRRADLPGEHDRIAAQLAGAARKHRPRLLALRAIVADRLSQLQVLPNLAQSRFTFILHGWTPATRVSQIRGVLRQRFGADVVVYDAPADPHDAGSVPVLLDNPTPIRPFQRMLALFRPPRYGHMDPTIYMALFFPLFVGIVIGDVAYGLLLFALAWWWRGKGRRGEGWTVPLMNIRLAPAVLADLSWILRIMATWTIVFGALYLEIFGNLVEHHFGLHPIFNRVELTTSFLKFAVALGIVQVMLGYLLHLILAVRHRHTVGVVESLAMICGVGALIALIGAVSGYAPQGLMTPGLALFVAFLLFVAVGVVMNWLNFVWLIEAISGFGNVLSYARLFGFGLAAAILANTSNQLGAGFGPVLVAAIAGIVIQMVFWVFTIAGEIIQPARLNWIEFLTKFKYHSETGGSYRPLHKTGGD